MATMRAADVPRKLNSIEALAPVIVVFGPDRGLVSETAGAVAKNFDDADDPFAVTKLDAATVTGEPGRLVDEARTISMFGGKRLVWVRDAAGKNLVPAVAPLLAEPPSDAVVLIEAGDLKKGTGLRKEAEAAKAALAIWCPADSERDLARMIDEEAAALGLKVEPDARQMLLDRLGADRAASRAEVSKACLHAAGTGVLSAEDVDQVVGDVSVSEMSAAVDAAFLGRREALDALLTKLLKQDSHAVQLLMNAQWAIHAFEPAAAAVASGTSPQRAAEGIRPPLYGPRKATGARVLEIWTPTMLRAAAHVVSEAIFRTRTMPALTGPVTRDAFLRLVSQPRQV